jgi:hypothetical protein
VWTVLCRKQLGVSEAVLIPGEIQCAGPNMQVSFFQAGLQLIWNDISSIMLYLLFREQIMVVLIPLGSSMIHAMPLLTGCMASDQILEAAGQREITVRFSRDAYS